MAISVLSVRDICIGLMGENDLAFYRFLIVQQNISCIPIGQNLKSNAGNKVKITTNLRSDFISEQQHGYYQDTRTNNV